jgi:hypothetical protein
MRGYPGLAAYTYVQRIERSDPDAIDGRRSTVATSTEAPVEAQRGQTVGRGMQLNEIASQDERVFSLILKDIRHILHLSYKEIEKKTGITSDRFHNICNKRTNATRAEFLVTIAKLVSRPGSEALYSYLECKYPQVFGRDRAQDCAPDVALAQWVEARDQRSTAFHRKCVQGPKGRFLLIRRDDEGKLICALMRVTAPADAQSLPTFNTIRFMPNGHKRKTDGFIFELHGRVYAIGKLDNIQGLRFSNLHIHQHSNRYDLFGIRVGILGGMTFASRLYAYQIQASARAVGTRPGILKRILMPWHPDDNRDLVTSISGFKHIYAMLEPGRLIDNGITASA